MQAEGGFLVPSVIYQAEILQTFAGFLPLGCEDLLLVSPLYRYYSGHAVNQSIIRESPGTCDV